MSDYKITKWELLPFTMTADEFERAKAAAPSLPSLLAAVTRQIEADALARRERDAEWAARRPPVAGPTWQGSETGE